MTFVLTAIVFCFRDDINLRYCMVGAGDERPTPVQSATCRRSHTDGINQTYLCDPQVVVLGVMCMGICICIVCKRTQRREKYLSFMLYKIISSYKLFLWTSKWLQYNIYPIIFSFQRPDNWSFNPNIHRSLEAIKSNAMRLQIAEL